MNKILIEIDEIAHNYRGNVVKLFYNLISFKEYVKKVQETTSKTLKGQASIVVNPSIQGSQILEKEISDFVKSNLDIISAKDFDSPTAYLNKTAILYLDALLQSFLDKITDLLYRTGKTTVNTESNGRCIYKKLCKLSDILPSDQFNCLHHVLFVGQLRHIITHTLGLVDKDFIDNCKLNNSNDLIFHLSHLWDDHIWKDENEFDKDYQIDKRLSIPIERVIFPYIQHSANFINEYSDASIKLLTS